MIAFIGSVFSPYYAWAGYRDPMQHCAINVAVYGRGAQRWSMTERTAVSVARSARSYQIGNSSMHWDGTALVIDVDERSAPFGRRIQGTIRLMPEAVTTQAFELDPDGRHAWWPIAPRSRIEATLTAPDLRFRGSAYFDSNSGEAPLQDGFTKWDWSRADVGDGAAILYDITRANGATLDLGLRFARDGSVEEVEPPPRAKLPPSAIWRLPRQTQCDDGNARVIKTFEDTPFYARSKLQTQLFGNQTVAIHESLSLDRFTQPWVRCLLPFRMPRWPFAVTPRSDVAVGGAEDAGG
ncbi:MAG: carotenoid 1,2-hydratase [Pseudomonadota bacterium]